MEKWVTRFGRAVMVGFAWAAGWMPVGMISGALRVGELEPEHIGGPLYAGVLCGTVFALISGIASGRRKYGDLSFARAAAYGLVTGALIGLLPFVIGDQKASDRPVWLLPLVLSSSMAAISAVSGVVSVILARWFRKQNAPTPASVL